MKITDSSKYGQGDGNTITYTLLVSVNLKVYSEKLFKIIS